MPPMFEVESTRSVAVHPLSPEGGGLPTPGLVADHLDTLLGEQLLPLRLREGAADEPYLLAVDASGQPVVVEICAVLDEAAVVKALRHAGRAASMSAQDLARAYPGGPGRFAAHLEAFRETVPATTLLPTSVRSGARLLLVCSAIAPGMEDVVEFLLQPGWRVDVLTVGVVPGADGARIVGVAPLTRVPPPRRAMEPARRAPRRPSGGTWPFADPQRRMPGVTPPPFAVRTAPSAAAADPPPEAPPPAAPAPDAPPPGPDGRLIRVATHLGAPAALVWQREDGGYHEALLHADGWIELPDGTRLRSPDEAAAALTGDAATDGWRVWHVERPDGPSLADALERASG
ncbi:hypothetical protein [Actinotalea sp. JY-7876]|uniref:restriction system modified-DNA reader domain-containing protein n=1 Tax=Actinotalea sp. JY-7876 TaxID=2758442 RepID=UPI0015F5C986|nr:hypothetical protein [Actinotalea sp. JY-7876]